MTIRLVIRHRGQNIPSSIFFSEIPFKPDETEFFIAMLKDNTNVEIERFVSKTLVELLKEIKDYLDKNLMKIVEIIKPYSNPSAYADEFESNEHILLI